MFANFANPKDVDIRDRALLYLRLLTHAGSGAPSSPPSGGGGGACAAEEDEAAMGLTRES